MFKKKFQNQEVAEIITAGDCLRRRREESNLSLKKISDELGIKNEYLENLEKGNYKDLPPQVYVRGFIKSYAGYLGIDGGQLIKIYNREMTFSQEDKKGEEKEKNGNIRLRDYLVVTPKIVTLATSIFVITVLGYYFLHQINSFNSKPYLFVESPTADQVVKERDLVVSGKTESDAILKINGQDISVNGDGVFRQKIALSEGRNVLVIEARNRFDKVEKKEFDIIYEKPLEEGGAITEAPDVEEDLPTSDNNQTDTAEKKDVAPDKSVSPYTSTGGTANKKNAIPADTAAKNIVPASGNEAVKEDVAADGTAQTETEDISANIGGLNTPAD